MRRISALFFLAILAGALTLYGRAAAPRTASAHPTGLVVWIELDRKRLTVYENGAEIAVFPIASGRRDTPSPIGVFRVTQRFATQYSGFGTRFLGLNVPFGQYGVHGTNAPSSIGQSASHGCIRLRAQDAERLYSMVPYGTRVVVEGGAYGALSEGLRPLRDGDRGSDVMLLQRRLSALGYLRGGADGVYGTATRAAVLRANQALLRITSDVAGEALQGRLGMLRFE